MDQLGRLCDRSAQLRQPREMPDRWDPIGSELSEGDAIAERPGVCALLDERRFRDVSERGMEPASDLDDVSPSPLLVPAGKALEAGPASDDQAAAATAARSRHAKALLREAREQISLETELLLVDVKRLEYQPIRYPSVTLPALEPRGSALGPKRSEDIVGWST